MPRAVDGVVQRLLTKDPDGRYQSASSVVADITEIIDALDAGVADPAVAAGLHDRRHALTEPSFVGRADVLGTLTGLLDRATRADGGLVLVEAESGGGKTRLLDEVALQAAQQHFWVLRGQGLLRGDHCHIIELHGELGGDLTTQSEDTVGELSRSLVEQAIEQRAVVVSGAGEQDAAESLLLARLTSVVCAPIVSDGEVIACFYVTNRHVHDLFGAIEVQLAEFIATLAGAALEHVAGSEARFRSLAQHSSDVITIVDRSGRITYQSSSLERVFGYRPEDLVGQELRSWLHPEDTESRSTTRSATAPATCC